METMLVYYDETGDDGLVNSSSDDFVLTGVYMNTNAWKANYTAFKNFRLLLREKYGFHAIEEMHTKHFLTDKDPYRKYGWTAGQKREILIAFVKCIAEQLDLQIVNVIIDKKNVTGSTYPILEKALTYSIQRIENDSGGKWNYIIIADKGRIAPMRRTARAIRAYNPIQSHYSPGYTNEPITGLIEDILEKDSSESYFIQICDFVSYFVHLYYKCVVKGEPLPNRAAKLIDTDFVKKVMGTLKHYNKLNVQASKSNKYGLVIYPKARP